jgi:hypothetical protein
MKEDADARAYDALSKHPRLRDLALLTRAVVREAAQARRTQPSADRVRQVASELQVDAEAASSPLGNALDVLLRGPEDPAERSLANALWAHAIAVEPPGGRDQEDRLASDLLWLAAHTAFDATGLLDAALGEASDGMWDAIGQLLRRYDDGALPPVERGEALVGAIAIAASSAQSARRLAAALAIEARDEKLAFVLAHSSKTSEPIFGEMAPVPRGLLASAALGLSGISLLLRAARALRRVALAYRQPAEVALSPTGDIRVRWRTELLGRTLGDRDVLVPRSALLRATRDVRYPRLAFYAALSALALGSYVGLGAFIDGVRAASPSLLATGLGLVAAGLALDFVFTSVVPGARGRCRLVFTARDGKPLCIGGVEIASADALLARIARGR